MASESLGNHLWVERARREHAQLYSLRGRIDESSRLAEFASSITGDVILDLDGIEHINSMGVRSWVRMMGILDSAGCAVTLRHCREHIIYQLNMIAEAKLNATVESMYAPYECESCEERSHELLQVSPSLRRHQPTRECPECGGVSTFVEIPEVYFQFLDPLES